MPRSSLVHAEMLHAANQNQIDRVLWLIKVGADVNACYASNQETALHSAVKEGRIEMVQALLKAGANPNYRCDMYNYNTPLTSAVSQGSIALVKALLAAGADVHNGYDPENAPWMIDYDAEGDQVELTQALIEAGAYMGPDSDGWTPLMFAAWNGKTKAAALLIEAGCDVNVNYCDDTVLMIAAQGHKEGTLDTIQLLLKSGADVNFQTENGHTPLIRAAIVGHSEAVRLLLSAGADVFYRAETEPARYGKPAIKAKNAYDLADDEAVKEILKSEMHRRIAAVLSVLHPAMPVDVRQKIVRLYLEQGEPDAIFV